MKFKEALSQVAELIAKFNKQDNEFSTIKTIDEKEIKFSKLEKGEQITILSEENYITAPIGEYELEDGRIIKLEEEGIISEVIEKPVELITSKLIDGRVVEYDGREAGAKIIIVTGEGDSIERKSAPAGTYELEDGSKIVVVDEGIVSEFIAFEEPSEEMSEQVAELFAKMQDVLVQNIERTMKIENVIAELVTGFGTFKGDITELHKKYEEIAKNPSTIPTFRKDKKDTKLKSESRQSAIDIIKQLKSK